MAGEEWLDDVEARAHRAMALLPATEPADVAPLLDAFARSIEPPPDHAHAVALSALFIRVAHETLAVLHARGTLSPCSCAAAAWSDLDALIDWRSDRRLAFRTWMSALTGRFETAHPPTIADRAAAVIRADPDQTGSSRAIARRLGIGAAALRQAIRARFGMRLSQYVQLARVTRALSCFQSAMKVEAVALVVGYRSKKDLYAALARWTGATPSDLRNLPESEREWLVRLLRAKCLSGVAGACAPASISAASGASGRSNRPARRPRPRRPPAARRPRT